MAEAGNIEGRTDGNATVDNLEMNLKSYDPGLCRFKEEFIKFSVSSKATMKFLQPREVRTMNIPEVYKRMIISEIIHLQSPSSRTKLKNEEADSPAQGQGEQDEERTTFYWYHRPVSRICLNRGPHQPKAQPKMM